MSNDASTPALSESAKPRRFNAVVLIWAVSAVLMLGVALLWAGGKRRHTGDTWIGLAAGKLICEKGFTNFPLKDQFTAQFNAKTWTNQNWLVHVAYWVLYDKVGNWALVAFKLFLVAVSALLLYRTSEILCQDRAISLFVTSAGMLVATEFIDIRPNHVGILGAATLMWMLMSLKYGKRWPIWWLPVLMLFWGCAHGSFLFGYVLIGMFVCTELFQHFVRRSGIYIDLPTAIRLCISTVVSVFVLVLVSPYHFHNFTHPLVIMVGESADVFQNVMEWKPSYQDFVRVWNNKKSPDGSLFYMRPSVEGFFYLLMCSLVVWVSGVAGWLTQREPPRGETDDDARTPAAFDLTEIAVVLAVLYFAITSRRFVFLYIALAVPWTAKMMALALRSWFTDEPAAVGPFPPGLRNGSRIALTVLNVIGIIIFSFAGYIYSLPGGRFNPDMSVWLSYFTPEGKPLSGDKWFALHTSRNDDLLEILKIADDYELEGRVFNEWTWGGYMMLHAPRLKLFIDGRSQALFTPTHFTNYWLAIQGAGQDRYPADVYAANLDRGLAEAGIDVVILKRRPKESNSMINPLMNSHNWEMISESEYKDGGVLMVRVNSANPSIKRLLRAFYADEIERPNTRLGYRIRGYALQRGPNPDYRKSLEFLKKSLAIGPEPWVYDGLVRYCFAKLGDRDGEIAFFENELKRLNAAKPRNDDEKSVLEKCIQTVRRNLTDLKSTAQDLDPNTADAP